MKSYIKYNNSIVIFNMQVKSRGGTEVIFNWPLLTELCKSN